MNIQSASTDNGEELGSYDLLSGLSSIDPYEGLPELLLIIREPQSDMPKVCTCFGTFWALRRTLEPDSRARDRLFICSAYKGLPLRSGTQNLQNLQRTLSFETTNMEASDTVDNLAPLRAILRELVCTAHFRKTVTKGLEALDDLGCCLYAEGRRLQLAIKLWDHWQNHEFSEQEIDSMVKSLSLEMVNQDQTALVSTLQQYLQVQSKNGKMVINRVMQVMKLYETMIKDVRALQTALNHAAEERKKTDLVVDFHYMADGKAFFVEGVASASSK